MNAERSGVKARAEELGASLERDENARMVTFQIHAPDGHRWRADKIHSLVVVCGDSVNSPGAWLDAANRMADGLEECPPDCECRE